MCIENSGCLWGGTEGLGVGGSFCVCWLVVFFCCFAFLTLPHYVYVLVKNKKLRGPDFPEFGLNFYFV